MSHDGAHYKTTKKQFNWTFKKGIWTWSCHGYENCLFTKSVLCFSSRSQAWLCPSKPDRQGGKESTGGSWPFLRCTGPNRKVESAYLHRPWANEYHCSKEKGWVTSQWAAKRNRLLLLCTMAAGTGLKGGFVRPGGRLNAMAWLQRLACGLSGNGLALQAIL